jgi:XTP/dITP diphosphohydrolase
VVSRARTPGPVRFVTSNSAKLSEVEAYLGAAGIPVQAVLRRLPEPQADELEPVVQAKLEATRDLRGTVLVEDSGLFVDALKGFPGPYSSYAYRTLGLGGLLLLLHDRPRTARFRTVVGLRHDGRSALLAGEVEGTIAAAPRGTNGFAFDPLFEPGAGPRTFAEMSLEEKNAHSHRARALALVVHELKVPPAGRA